MSDTRGASIGGAGADSTTTAPAGPGPIWDVINGFAGYWALHTGVDLGLFDALASGGSDADALAAATGVRDPQDLALLADVLVSLGLLGTDGLRYQLTPSAQRFLVSSSPASMVELVRCSPGPHSAWPALGHTLRAGAPAPQIGAELGALYPRLVRATAGTQRAVADGVAAALTERDLWGSTAPVLLDLGCGSGAWLAGLLDGAGEGAGAVAVDLPHVLDEARATLAGRPVTFVAGDYLDVELPVERADVVVLAHVLRAEPAPRAAALVARALDLLAGRGTLLVADYFRPDAAQLMPAYPAARHELMLSLTMRASTAGRGVTEAQLHGWLADRHAEVACVIEPVARQRVHIVRARQTGGTG